MPSQVRNPCQGLQLPSDGRRFPQGARLNTLSPGCSTTKTHAEQRHFHHASHSSRLTGTAKLRLMPPLCAGAHTHRQQQLRVCLPGMAGVLSGCSTKRSPGHHGHPLQNSRAMGETVSPRARVTPAQGWRDGQSWMRCSKTRLVQAVGARAWCSPSLIPQWLPRPPGSKHTATVTF